MKKIICMLLALVMLLSLVACGTKEAPKAEEKKEETTTTAPEKTEEKKEEAPAAPTGEKLKMGFIFNSLDNPIYVHWRDLLEELAPQYNFELTYLTSDEDAAKELANMEDLINSGCDVIGMSPADSEASKQAVQLAADAGIPVFTLDRVLEDVTCITQAITDNYAAAAVAGNEAVKVLGPEGGKIAVLRGIYGLSIETDRYEGFMSVINQHPEIEVVTEAFGDFHREKGTNAAEDILQAYPDVDLIYCENGEMAVGCLLALEAAGYKPGDVVVFGFDGAPDELKAIKEGNMYGCVFQVFNDMLPDMIKNVRKYMDGGNVPILTEYSAAFCTAENVDRYWWELKS